MYIEAYKFEDISSIIVCYLMLEDSARADGVRKPRNCISNSKTVGKKWVININHLT